MAADTTARDAWAFARAVITGDEDAAAVILEPYSEDGEALASLAIDLAQIVGVLLAILALEKGEELLPMFDQVALRMAE